MSKDQLNLAAQQTTPVDIPGKRAPFMADCFQGNWVLEASSNVVDRIIDHLKSTFIADRPPPLSVLEQAPLMAIEASVEYL